MLVRTKVIKDKRYRISNWRVPPEIQCKKSIYLFDRSGKFRRICHYLQNHRYFERFIMFLIVISSLQLALETYIDVR